MRKKIREAVEEGKRQQETTLVQTVCILLVIVLFVVLPLYTREGYYMLGDAKYLLFRNTAALCLGIGLAATAIEVCCRKTDVARGWSSMDTAMVLYAMVCIVSFLLSSYPETAWRGYRDWYMGAFSQLLFVGIYFLVSRQYTGAAYPLYLGEATLGCVAGIGFLQKMGWNPLHLLDGYVPTDWGYSHMLSTVGNINWLCGYLAVVISLPVTGYLYSRRGIRTFFWYLISSMGLTLLCMQGSEIGIGIAIACIGVCLLAGLRNSSFFAKGLSLLTGTLLGLSLLDLLLTLRGTMYTMPAENNIFYRIPWYCYLLAAVGSGSACVVWEALSQKAKKAVCKTVVALGAITAVMAAGCYLYRTELTPAWGSGRGGLWMASWQGFWQGNGKQKLIGAGPDCFAEYLYTHLDMDSILEMEGQWSRSVFANAHNEWLNTLINLGIAGVLAYLGIFICGLRRYRGMLLGVLVLVLYAVNSLVSFQQVMNAPVFFLLLGLCENRMRGQSG